MLRKKVPRIYKDGLGAKGGDTSWVCLTGLEGEKTICASYEPKLRSMWKKNRSAQRGKGRRRACRMDFCPNCGTRLTPLKKKEGRKVALLLSCPKCGYEKRATRPMTTVPKILEYSPQDPIMVIGKKEQKLRTLPTVKIECPRCGNSLAYAWMVHGKSEESSTQFFRCTKCNYTFREKS